MKTKAIDLGHVTTSCDLNVVSTQSKNENKTITLSNSSEFERKAQKIIQLIYGDDITLEHLNYSFKNYYDFYLALINDFNVTQTSTKYPIDLRYVKEIFEKI